MASDRIASHIAEQMGHPGRKNQVGEEFDFLPMRTTQLGAQVQLQAKR
ncbi:hypothetical protein X750_31975 [Mesorhizobium sp. LNJC394B00]|nr:hypothetical protein X750_31975 [Mesorhizobium sp. LNJC394B00]